MKKEIPDDIYMQCMDKIVNQIIFEQNLDKNDRRLEYVMYRMGNKVYYMFDVIAEKLMEEKERKEIFEETNSL